MLWKSLTFKVLVAGLLWVVLSAKVQAQFTFETNNGTLTVAKYTGSGGAVIIPDGFGSLPVTCIGGYAFYYASGVTSVTIPDSITNIGLFAFQWCSLTGVTMGNGVTDIGAGAFENCSGLTTVAFGNGLRTIGNYAFANCPVLTDVSLPSSVTNIGELEFTLCSSLSAINVDTSNPVFSSVNGVLFDKNQTTIVEYPGGLGGSYTIPESVTNIGFGAFESTSLTSVTIGNGVVSVGENAFSSCSSLTNVSIGNRLASIEGGTFAHSSGLVSISIGTGVTAIGEDAFAGCSSLTSITIPNGVTSIGTHAFDGCSSLTNVTIGNGVSSIGDYAFWSCTSLKGLYFQGNAPTIDFTLFGCANNPTVYYLPGTIGWDSTFAGAPTAFWTLPYPLILNGSSFGVLTNGFGFIISWATNTPVIVDACADLLNPAWAPISTNHLTNGTSYFSDPQWTNYPSRFYRIRSP
jgi:hypothetical protein